MTSSAADIRTQSSYVCWRQRGGCRVALHGARRAASAGLASCNGTGDAQVAVLKAVAILLVVIVGHFSRSTGGC